MLIRFGAGLVISTIGAALPALAVSHREVRMEVRSLSYSQSKQSEKREVTKTTIPFSTGTTSTTAQTTTTTQKTTKSENWSAFSAIPSLDVAIYHDGLVVATTLYGFFGLLGGDLRLGYEMSKGFELGLFTRLNYGGGNKKEKGGDTSFSSSSTPADPNAEVKTNDGSRQLAIGPYVRYAASLGKNSLDTTFILTKQENGSDDTSYSVEHKKQSGYGISLSEAFVLPLSKSVAYFAELQLGYSDLGSGSESSRSSSSFTEEKIKQDTTTRVSITPLGIRMSLGTDAPSEPERKPRR